MSDLPPSHPLPGDEHPPVTFPAPGSSSSSTPPPVDPPPTVTPPVSPSPGPVDPDVAPVPQGNDLADLRAELAAEVAPDDLVLEVPLRDGWQVRYSCDISKDEIKKWRKAAADKKAPDGIDELRMAELVAVNKCVALQKRGQDVLGDDGDPLAFRHPELLTMYRVGKAVEAASAFYGSDGHLIAAARQVLDQAGWGAELTEAGDEDGPDPTVR